ncbi:hypothetical protein Hanom_Chr07g00615111 [Helianthus anomalus]
MVSPTSSPNHLRPYTLYLSLTSLLKQTPPPLNTYHHHTSITEHPLPPLQTTITVTFFNLHLNTFIQLIPTSLFKLIPTSLFLNLQLYMYIY